MVRNGVGSSVPFLITRNAPVCCATKMRPSGAISMAVGQAGDDRAVGETRGHCGGWKRGGTEQRAERDQRRYECAQPAGCSAEAAHVGPPGWTYRRATMRANLHARQDPRPHSIAFFAAQYARRSLRPVAADGIAMPSAESPSETRHHDVDERHCVARTHAGVVANGRARSLPLTAERASAADCYRTGGQPTVVILFVPWMDRPSTVFALIVRDVSPHWTPMSSVRTCRTRSISPSRS